MRAFLHRNRWYLLAGCALFFGARWAFQQGKPERLQDLSITHDSRINTLLGIHKGFAYFKVNEFQTSRSVTITNNQGKNVPATITPPQPFLIRTLPVTGKQARMAGEDRRPDHFFQMVQRTGDSLYYSAAPHKVRPVAVTYGGYGAGPSTISAGSPNTKPKNVVIPVSVTKVFLFQMRLTGGPPIALRPDMSFQIANISYTNGQQIAVVGDSIYWIEVKNGQRLPGAIASLRVISLHGGPPETLMKDIPYGTGMAVPEEDTESLWLSVPAKGNIAGCDLYRLTAAERKPRRIMRQESAPLVLSTPLALNDRLYWTHDVQEINKPSPDTYSYQTRHTEILSAALDGSDSRIIHTFPHACYASSARVHQGKLYLEEIRGESRPMQSNRYLVRLEPGPPARVYDVFHFPPTASPSYFDGDYVYYTLREERDNFWDWSGKGALPVEATVLCRYRLPR